MLNFYDDINKEDTKIDILNTNSVDIACMVQQWQLPPFTALTRISHYLQIKSDIS